jgi:hypothetical protein
MKAARTGRSYGLKLMERHLAIESSPEAAHLGADRSDVPGVADECTPEDRSAETAADPCSEGVVV